jgi:CHASE2 domain-containing sensor protein
MPHRFCSIFIKLGSFFAQMLHWLFTPLRWLFTQPPFWLLHFLGRWFPQPRAAKSGIFSPFGHQLVSNIWIGLLILGIVLTYHDIRLLTTIEDLAVDWVMAMQLNTELKNKDTPHFVFLDIDELTYRQWEEPLITPRDKLLNLIKFAVSGQPQIIFIDIELSRPTDRNSATLTPADQELQKYLANYDATVCTGGKVCPHLVLVRSSRPVPEEAGNRQQRPSFLDEAVKSSQYIHWASTLFELEESRIIRRWRLCEAEYDKTELTLPSVQLLARELLKPGQTPTQLTARIGTECHKDSSTLGQRILYGVMPKNYKEPYPQTAQGRNILTTLSAHIIVEKPDQVSNEALQHSITVIGGSYEESGDLYATPLGVMPGVLIVVNAIHSLQQYPELHKPDKWKIVLTEIGLILLMSWAFACFTPSFYGMLVSGLVIILVMMPVSFVVFKYGVWLDFAIPLIAVQLHRMAAVLHHHPVVVPLN